MASDSSEDSSSRTRHRSNVSREDSLDSATDFSLPVPPDGGWGWVIVFASFMSHMIADGCAFSFGVLYVELLDYFQESKGKTAWVGSLFISVPLIAAPVASALTNKYGCRPVTMAGGLLSACGFTVSAFMPSIELLCVSFGLVSGFGLALVYVPAIVVVAFYFEKRRALATGIAVAGTGTGTFIFSPLTERLIEIYGWQGAMLILGGVNLNIVLCGSLFRPLESKKEIKRKKFLQSLEKFSRNSSNQSFQQEYAKICNGHATLPAGLEYNPIANGTDSPHWQQTYQSLLQLPSHKQNYLNERMPEILRELDKSGRTVDELMHDWDFLQRVNPTHSLKELCNKNLIEHKVMSQISCSNSTGQPSTSKQTHPDRENVWRKRRMLFKQQSQPPDTLWMILRKDIFYRGSLMRMPTTRVVSCPDIFLQSQAPSFDGEKCECGYLRSFNLSKEVKHILKKMMDINLFKNFSYVLFCISNMLLYMWYDVPYVYSPDKAIKMGIKESHASFLLAIMGITSTVGQIVIGYIGDRPQVNSLNLYNVLTSVTGVATILVPVCYSYASLCVFAATFGFFISGNYSLTTIILVDLLGMDNLTNAMGLIMLGQGISNLTGPPLAGWISDKTGSYDATFYMAGAFILLSGLMLIIIPVCYHFKNKDSHPENDLHPTESQPQSLTDIHAALPQQTEDHSSQKSIVLLEKETVV